MLIRLAAFFNKRCVKLLGIAVALAVTLPFTFMAVKLVWDRPAFGFSEYRGQSIVMDSSLGLIFLLFVTVYLVLRARRLLKGAPRRSTRR
jgi:hypothetical protein